MYEQALKLATKAHEGQTRWDPNVPYITHPLAIAEHFDCPVHKTVAILHDVVEDTDVTLEDIRLEFGEEIAASIDAITKRDGETYDQYLIRVMVNPVASNVKIKDIEHNVSTLPTKKDAKTRLRRERYALARFILKNREKFDA
jgi:(p)ppGpp synthase/HD superfamily hydrolase